MASLLDMTVRFGADTAQYKRALKKTKQDTDQWSGQITNAMKNLSGVIAGAFSVGAVVDFGRQAVQAYNESAQAEAKLLTALKGREGAMERLKAVAGELQKKTLFDDDATVQAMAFLAQLRLTENEIRTIIPLVQDFAQAQNMELGEAAKLVAKSIGSSTNALKRYGVEIEGAVGSSDRLTSAVDALNKMVGGQAVAAAEAGTGAVTQLNNAWGDFMENIGSHIVPGLNTLGKAGNEALTFMSSEKLGFMMKFAWLVAGIKPSLEAMAVAVKDSFQATNLLAAKSTEELKKERDALKELLDSWTDQTEARKESVKQYEALNLEIAKRTIATINETNAIEAQKKAEAALNAQRLRERNAGTSGISIRPGYDTEGLQIANPITPGLIEEVSINGDKFNKELKDWQNDLARQLESVNSMIEGAMADIAATFAEGLGNAIVTGDWKNLFKSILAVVADFMSQLGKALMAMGVAQIVAKKAISSFNGYAMIGAAAALLVAAGALKAVMDKGMDEPRKFASGGIVSSPTLAMVGEYAGANRNPEVIAPLSDLQRILGTGAQVVTVHGKLYGADLLISNERSSYQRSRIRGF